MSASLQVAATIISDVRFGCVLARLHAPPPAQLRAASGPQARTDASCQQGSLCRFGHSAPPVRSRSAQRNARPGGVGFSPPRCAEPVDHALLPLRSTTLREGRWGAYQRARGTFTPSASFVIVTAEPVEDIQPFEQAATLALTVGFRFLCDGRGPFNRRLCDGSGLFSCRL